MPSYFYLKLIGKITLKNNLTSVIHFLPPLSILLIAGGIRFIGLDNHPLWLDEIYGYQLSREGFRAILINSLTDPHPPLYYIIQWVLSFPVTVNNEWAWRWFPALTGTLTVLIIYLLAKKVITTQAAFASALLIAISPSHVFYSQEGRSTAFITFLAALSILIIRRILHEEKNQSKSNSLWWISLILISFAGLYSSYSYLLIVGIQGIFLLIFYYKKINFLLYASILLFSVFGLAPFTASLSKTNEIHYETENILGLSRMVQSLIAGEPVRYGIDWPHTIVPIILTLFAFVGSAYLIAKKSPFGLYLVIQTILPALLFFSIVAPFINLRLPLPESKQFMVLLPSFFVLVAVGVGEISNLFKKRVGSIASTVLILIVVFGSYHELYKYWTITKSPEGHVVLFSREYYQDSDILISLHYSTNASIDFYIPGAKIYTYPHKGEHGYTFSTDISVLHIPRIIIPDFKRPNLEQVRRNSRIWLYTYFNNDPQVIEEITYGCKPVLEEKYFPFSAILFEDCPILSTEN
jgi:uncharacterized membrane protein